MYAHLLRNSKKCGPYIMRISHFLIHFSMFNKVKNMQYYNASNVKEKQSKNIPLSKKHLKMSGIIQKKQMFLQMGSQEIKAEQATNMESGEGKKKRHSLGLLNKIRLRKNSSKSEKDGSKTGKEKDHEKLLTKLSMETIKKVPLEAVESDDVHLEITQSKSGEGDDNYTTDKPIGDAETNSSTGFKTDGPNKAACCSLGDEKNADRDIEIRKNMFSELELCEHKKYQENGMVRDSETSSGSASSIMQQQLKGLHGNVPGERRLSILGGALRKRSLFEEAVENNQNNDYAINDAIETELINMKKRGSLSLALFKGDLMTVKPCNAHLKSKANSIKENNSSQSFTHDSLVKMTKPNGNKSNNAKQRKSSKTNKQMKLLGSKKMKTEAHEGCRLCGNGTCLYPLAPWQELLKCQLSAAMYNIKHHDRFRNFFDSSRSVLESNLFSQSKFTES